VGMHQNVSRRAAIAVIAAFVAGASGCGARRFEVTGKVKYNGAVLDKPDGQVVFVGPNGEQAVAPIGPDGGYRASGVTAGLNKVVAYYPNPKAKREKVVKPKAVQAPAPNEPLFLTPAKYATADTTDLSLTVDKDTQHDIELTGLPVR
jgi:hypothetical protein